MKDTNLPIDIAFIVNNPWVITIRIFFFQDILFEKYNSIGFKTIGRD
jgi:hypothetical protein